jgi:histidyl-tRNA synthetase
MDAEMIGLAFQGLAQVGIRECQLVIGHVGLTRQLLSRFQLDNRTEQFLLKHVDALRQPNLGKSYVLEQFEQSLTGKAGAYFDSHLTANDALTLEQTEFNTQRMLQSLLDATQRGATMGGRTQHDIARRLLQKQQRLTERQQVRDALDFLERWTSIQASPPEAIGTIEALVSDDLTAAAQFHSWQETIELLDIYGVEMSNILLQPYLARNWAYYTGIVFEINAKNGAQVASGGRYDELIALIGAKRAVPAVGFAYYLDAMLDQLESPFRNAEPLIYIPLIEDNVRAASALAVSLRTCDMTTVLMPSSAVDDRYPVVHIAADGSMVSNLRYKPLKP